MDQVLLGQFIAQRRKARKLTQAQLAELLGITDRAVSKWETGRSLPDASIMLALCDILEITVNDLLHGEVVDMAEYNHKSEEMLVELTKQKVEADRRMLSLEIMLGFLALGVMLALVFMAALMDMAAWLRVLLIVVGMVTGITGALLALRIEQSAGYYHCEQCGHKYVPTYKSVLWAMHVQRTRYMRCPECGKWSWQKKVLTKE